MNGKPTRRWARNMVSVSRSRPLARANVPLGDVVHFNVFGSHVVVLNSYEATRDLLDARGSIYSSRPRLVMLKEVYVYSIIILTSSS